MGKKQERNPIELLRQCETLAFDVENDPTTHKLEMFSAAGRRDGKIISAAFMPDRMDEFLHNCGDKMFIGHNFKHEQKIMTWRNKENPRVKWNSEKVKFHDTMIQAHLLDETALKDLKTLRVRVLGLPARKGWKDIDKNNKEEYLNYNREDSVDSLLLHEEQMPKIISEGLEEVYDLERAVVYPLVAMETRGCLLDLKLLEKQRALLEEYIYTINKKIKKEVGYELNISSTKQLQDLFFRVLQYPFKDDWRTKTGVSTASPVLEWIAEDKSKKNASAAKIAKLLTDNRMYSKVLSAFINPFIEKNIDGYIYGSFNACGTVTGRFSASDPNLQQVKAEPFDFLKDSKGKYIVNEDGDYIPDYDTHLRSLFIAEKGKYLLTADYSQIELRMAAILSRDRNMCNAFIHGADPHALTASLVGCTRRQAKVINFATLYGMGGPSMAHKLGVSPQEGYSYINKFWKGYPGIKSLKDEIIRIGEKQGFIRTISGRKCRFTNRTKGIATTGLNSAIQGSCADLMKAAMVSIWKEMDHKRYTPIMTVHDEYTGQVDIDYAEEAKEIKQYCMENVFKSIVPIIAEPKVGLRWSETK